MGFIHADIKLNNAGDLMLASRNLIREEDVQHITVMAFVDTRCFGLFINENIRQLLLSLLENRKSCLADGAIIEYDVVVRRK